MNKRLTIFDADSIIFIVAYHFRAKKSAKMVEMHVNKFIADILKNSQCSHYVGFFGSKEDNALPNFRYSIDPNYKAKRPPAPDFIIKWRPTILKVFKDKWGFVPIDGMEADDAAVIAKYYYEKEFEDFVIVSADKDLKQVPNTIFYDMNKHTMEDISEFKANYNLCTQLLMGDKGTDNIPGLPGIGKKKAAALLDACTTKEQLKWKVIRAYIEFEVINKTKLRSNITQGILSDIKALEDAGKDLPEQYKGLSGPRLERKIRINTTKELANQMEAIMPGGYKTYFKQQYALLKMLTEAPDFFTVPDYKESPVASLVEGTITTKTAPSKLKDVDDFLLI